MKKILLDTNAYSDLLKGNDSVLQHISTAELVLMSVVVVAELKFGFKKGTKFRWNQEILQKFLSKPSVQIVDVCLETSDIFSDIKLKLTNKGTPIPLNDVWIAAQAIEHGAVLLTFDKHFKLVDGLRLVQ